jgi:trigger factor
LRDVVKVTSERLPDAQVVLSIEVEPEQVAKAEQRAYQSLSQRIRVPGFRPGKAPRFMVERMIGGPDVLRQEGLERLLPEVYREAIIQEGIEPIDQPEMEIVSTEPVIVKATVSVQPTVELGDYKSIRVPKVPVDVPYERINETIERLREQRTEWNPVERAAQAGDRVVIDVSGTIGAAPTLFDASGQPLLQTEGRESFIDSKNAELEIDLESTAPLPGFHQELVGIAPKGEKRFQLSIPDDWPNEEQRKQSVLFHVVVNEVKEPKVPALDDEFAQGVGEYQTFDALRDDVRERLRQQLEHEAEHVYQDQVIREAVDRSSFELPPALVRRETERMVQNFEQNLARQRLSLEQYLRLTNKSREEMQEEMRPQAEANLKAYLVLREIGAAEKIEVSEDEVNTEIERIAGLMGDEAEAKRAREYLEQQRRSGDIRSSLWERKITEFVVEMAQQPVEASAEAAAPEGEEDAPAAAEAPEAEAEPAPKPRRSRAKPSTAPTEGGA